LYNTSFILIHRFLLFFSLGTKISCPCWILTPRHLIFKKQRTLLYSIWSEFLFWQIGFVLVVLLYVKYLFQKRRSISYLWLILYQLNIHWWSL
jgi:hypothetical protein